VATEDVLYMLTGMGIETGIDLEAVTRTSWWLFGTLGRRPNGRVAQALGAKLGLAA
jgi:hydroxymethylglutaryl-CoA lyase